MRFLRFLTVLATLSALAIAGFQSATAQPFVPPFTQDGVLAYLEQIITLQQRINVLAVDNDSARETILIETLRQNAARVSQYGFAFARTQASLFDDQAAESLTEAPAEGPDQKSELEKFTTTVTQRIANLQHDLTVLNTEIRHTPSHQRSGLLSRRETLTGELNLANAQMELIGSLNDTVTKAGEMDTTSGLLKKVNNLSRSMTSLSPAINEEKDADGNPVVRPLTPVKDEATDDATTQKAESRRGLFKSGAGLFALWQKQNQLRDLKQQINTLRTATNDMRTQLRDTLQGMAKSGNSLAQTNTETRTLVEQKQDFDTLVDNFKRLSASVVPLTQAASTLDLTKQSAKDWQILTDNQLTSTARDFVWHMILLTIAIAVPLALSEVARRTTTLYVKDERRSRQLRLLRRIVFGAIIVVIIALNLASELGSLATYAGLLTAGIAVALQNVILSLAAHFFFFGRYGVRTGDRVTVGGVTGDVTQIGMVRLYLMEIEGSGDETRPTGRIVAFPNSILFQPTAFFKHIPA